MASDAIAIQIRLGMIQPPRAARDHGSSRHSPTTPATAAENPTMPAYILSVVEITQVTEDFKRYSAGAAALSKQFGGEYLIRGKPVKVYEGTLFNSKSVVVSRFPSMEQLKAFYESDEYQKNLKPLRANTGIYDIASFEMP